MVDHVEKGKLHFGNTSLRSKRNRPKEARGIRSIIEETKKKLNFSKKATEALRRG